MGVVGRHICGCVWVETEEDPDAVDGAGVGWRKISGCEDHPMKEEA